MRTVIILARKHGSKKFELVSGPEIPAQEQAARFKECRRSNVHPEWAEVQLWESGGHARSHDMLHPKEAKAKAERDAKAAAEAEEKKKAAQEAEASKAKATVPEQPKAKENPPA